MKQLPTATAGAVRRKRLGSATAMSLLLVLGAGCSEGEAHEVQTASGILQALDEIPECTLSGGPGSDEGNLDRARQRAALISELRDLAPEQAELPALMRERWTLMSNLPLAFTSWDGPVGAELEHAVMDDPSSELSQETVRLLDAAGASVRELILAEVEAVVADNPRSALAAQAYYPRARVLVSKVTEGDRSVLERARAALEDLLEHGTEDDTEGFMPPRMMMWLAEYGYERAADPLRVELLRSLAARFPDSREAGNVPGKLRQAEALGKPFALRFEDARNGETVDIAEMRGKVVVLDFWATWCAPCVAAMPHLEDLYREYHDRGLRIIGISLDFEEEEHGGLTKLRDFVQEREIPWPQHYLGGNDTSFTREWGITAIPQLFVIDREGNLHSTSAREQLDEMVPALLGL